MFREVLQNAVDNTEGGVGGLLMGFDGIAVDQYVRDGGAFDVQTIGMEYSVILKQIQTAAEMLDAGGAKEVSIHAEKMTTVIRLINDEYFVALTLAPNGNSGKARYLLRVSSENLRSQLE
ncbi:MAG: hypothetical protein KC416_14735 [Myxococcales bacterium]|nr:hypothetical protein [Myxococcales bacterium]